MAGAVEAPHHQHPIALVHAALPERAMQGRQRASPFCDQEQSGGVTVESVRQIEKSEFRPQTTQSLDDAKTQPAAAVNRDAGRFIQGEEVRVFVYDGALKHFQ